MQFLKKLYHMFNRSEKIFALVLFLFMIIGSALEVIGVGAIPAFIALLLNPETVQKYPLIDSFLGKLGIVSVDKLLVWGSILLIFIFLIKNSYLTYLTYLKAKFINITFLKFSVRLFNAYMTAPYTFHLNRNSAELMRNLQIEVKLVLKILTDILYGIMDLLLIAGIFMLLFRVEPLITIFVLLLLAVPSGIFLKIIKRKLEKHGKDRQWHSGERIKAVNQGLGILKESRVLGRDSYFIDIFTDTSSKYIITRRYIDVINKIPKYLIETVSVLGMLLIGVVMVMQGRDVNSIIPVLTLFGVAVMRLMPAFKEFIAKYTDIRFHAYAINPLYTDITELRKNRINLAYNKGERLDSEPLHLKNNIELQNIHYRYPGASKSALNGVSIQIKKGAAVGIVGPSGAGKSTLVDVLLGLFIPEKGKILVDGVDTLENLKGWRRNIGYIPQQIYLIDDKIRNNIAVGIPEQMIDDNKVHNAIQAAHLEELIDELSDGVDTIIGERGIRLSGGQRQRIGIARALYNNPEILVMDEATSALDNETEHYIIQSIERLRGDRTIIMIAHRLTTVKNCDVLFYLKEGKIISTGTYGELFSKSEEYEIMTG
jgi:ATP-binding cassette, subfamily B, bacterial PglK